MSSKQQNISGSSRRPTRDLAQVRRHVDTLIRGRVFTPNSSPPNVVGQPWTRMVAIDVDVVKVKTYQLRDLAGVICSQAGLFVRNDNAETVLPVEFKIFSISCWSEATHMSLYPQDFVSGNRVELTRADGSSAKNQWARAGYKYPANFSNVTFSSLDSGQMAQHFFSVECSQASRLESHIGVMWRSGNTKNVSFGYFLTDNTHCPKRPVSSGETGAIEIDVHQRHQEEECPESDTPSIEDVYSEVRALREQLRNLQPVMD